ncbi:MAG: hypothetical protein SPL46_08265 [Selenomonadaceae bacterium]|nr:hypothetical protein [Selenomonadaceae bacterium]
MNKRNVTALTMALTLPFACPQAVSAAPEDEAQAAEVAQMKAEIAALSARLNTLEQQLAAAQAKQEKKEKTSKAKKGADIVWSGSTKTGYMYDQEKHGTVKAEVRLKAKTKVDDTYDVAFGLKFKSTSAEPTESEVDPMDPKHVKDGHAAEKNKVKLYEASIGRSFGPVYVRLGVQSATVGEGLWLGKSSLNIGSLRYTMTPNDNVFLGYGRDSQDYLAESEKTQSRLLKFFQYEHAFGKDALAGFYLGAQQPERYVGVYGETPLVGKLSIMGEYVRNNNTTKPSMKDGNNEKNGYGYKAIGSHSDTAGYLLSLRYGQAKKKGDLLTSLNYFNVDQNLFMDDGYTAYDDYITQDGLKGFGLVLDYMTSDHTKLSLERYWAHTKPVAGNVSFDGKPSTESPYYTTYVKFTSKF